MRTGGPVDPQEIAALLMRAVSAHRSGNLKDARKLYKRILARCSDQFDALHMLGVLEAQSQNLEEALQLFDQAMKLNPHSADALTNKGRALTELRRHEEALHCYARAVSISPRHILALHNKGCSLLALNRSAEALAVFDLLLRIEPNFWPTLCNRGIALTDLQRYEEAVTSCDKALACKPTYAEALQCRGIAFEFMRRHDLALRDFKQATSLNPEIDYLLGSLILSQLYCCDWQELHQNRSRIIAELRAGKRVATPFAFLALSDSPQDALTCTKIYLADKCSAADRVLWRGQNYQHEKIRLAYVSADYRAHPVAHLTANVFELHDRSRFETFAISLGPDDKSEIRDRIQSSFDHFIEARLMSDRDIAELLYQREIDIAVDLLGYTEYHRIGIFAQRPAPIQVEYLGYPGTTGAAFIDYLLADRWVIPHDQQRFYSERIIYLPDSYQANDRRRPISERLPSRAEVGLPTTGFVFCCFNSLYKITPDMFDVWMRLLQAKDGSVLWLIQEDSTALINLRHQAEIRGVSPERLIFAPKIPLADHLARHRLADLFIDTLPYCGHTTASDALWAGLPVLMCLGSTFAGRVAASLLNAAGLPELITTCIADYEALALKLAHDSALLASIKAKLARNRDMCSLFDTMRYTRNIEAAYLEMWERHQRGEPPTSFAVDRRE